MRIARFSLMRKITYTHLGAAWMVECKF
jgi:hypothetical protein